MSTQTQTQQILAWLRQGRKLTALSALKRFQCLRLSARIHELRKQGHRVQKENVRTESRKNIARYKLA